MSVTVADLLKLPSLRQAKVIAGQKGLTKVVTSISVLESTDPGILIDEVFPQGEYFGSEIVITGFLNMADNVEQQYINMKRLLEGGEVGLILFYVGIFLKEIHPRLIQLANEQDFVLIVMPEKDPTLRYGEVIGEVTDLIYRDRARQDSLIQEILARVAHLPVHQRSVPAILKMLSDRLSATVLLCDRELHPLQISAWPRNLEDVIRKRLEMLEELPADRDSVPCGILPDSTLTRFTIRPEHGPRQEFLILKEGVPLNKEVLEQTMDVVRLGVNIWGREQEQKDVAIHELIRATLQDEPFKMRQLADIFHIQVADINEMWILGCEEQQTERFRRQGLPFLREYLEPYCRTVIADFYEGYLVAFLDWIEHVPERGPISSELRTQLEALGFAATLTRCYPLEDTSAVRRSFLEHHEMISTARKIWPRQGCYTLQELHFATQCCQIIEKGEAVLGQAMAPLRPLLENAQDSMLLETLETYLLDAGSSTARCAELLFLHNNTVKYRLNRTRTLLGCELNSIPELFPVYQAVALGRLTGGQKYLIS